MIRKGIIAVTCLIILLILYIIFIIYAFFIVRNSGITNVIFMKEKNAMLFTTSFGEINLNISPLNMLDDSVGSVAGEDTTNLIISFEANTDYSMVCTYDIMFEWLSDDMYQYHTPGVIGNEFTIKANIINNESVNEGINYINSEIDIADVIGEKTSRIVINGAKIESKGSNVATAIWNLTTRFYNTNADQSYMAGKNYASRFNVVNVKCEKGTISL